MQRRIYKEQTFFCWESERRRECKVYTCLVYLKLILIKSYLTNKKWENTYQGHIYSRRHGLFYLIRLVLMIYFIINLNPVYIAFVFVIFFRNISWVLCLCYVLCSNPTRRDTDSERTYAKESRESERMFISKTTTWLNFVNLNLSYFSKLL